MTPEREYNPMQRMAKDIVSLYPYVKRIRSQAQQEKLPSLSRLQTDTLVFVCDNEPLTMSVLAQMMCVSPQQMSRTVGELQDSGLLTRRIDSDCRRQIIVTATETGRALAFQFSGKVMGTLEDALGDLSEQERQALTESLALLRSLLCELTRSARPTEEPSARILPNTAL